MAWQPWNQWREFRERQRARVGDHSQVAPPVAIPDPIPPTGSPSLPHTSAFRTGLAGGLGLLAAYGLWQALGALDTVLTLVVVSAFLTLALNPVVERLLHAGLNRAGAVTVVFAVVLVIFTLLGLLVVPPVVTQSTELA